MDPNRLVDILAATLVIDQRETAEKELDEIHKIIGFAPLLLQIVTSENVPDPVKQAGAIYLKNMSCMYYGYEEKHHEPGQPIPFSIHEQDRQVLRANIIEAVIRTTNPIQSQLAQVVAQVVKHDYPERWTDIVEKVAGYLQSGVTSTWLGALVCLHQLIKQYEYKPSADRVPLNQAMTTLLPIIYRVCQQLIDDNSELAVTIQKQIFKCFFVLIQFTLPLSLITREVFLQWMQLIKHVIERDVPEQIQQLDEDDRPQVIWWKVKKWAMHILTRTFERYGSPGNVFKDYQKFADWYLQNIVSEMLTVLLRVLESYRQKKYLPPRILQQIFNFINQGVNHATSWKVMKLHMQVLVEELLYPLLCHTDEDQELWETDPVEFVRTKYDVFEEMISPKTAAQILLYNSASKRKNVLDKTVAFCVQNITKANSTPQEKDGALHIIGSLSEILLKKRVYKEQAEMMLLTYVYPELQSPHPFLRAKACWVLKAFNESQFSNQSNIVTAMELCKHCLCADTELPVKVEAAMTIEAFVTQHDTATKSIQPHIREVVMKTLDVLRESENDELTGILQNLVHTYVDEITPMAQEMMEHLAGIYFKLLSTDDIDESDDRSMAAVGLVHTMETILTVCEESQEILNKLEEVVLKVVAYTFQNNLSVCFEEIFGLVYILSSHRISPSVWQLYFTMYEMFKKDDIDYFPEMTPTLHNYLTVDPPAFASNPKHLEMLYEMCKDVFASDNGEDSEVHAAKLLEVLILQYRGSIDTVLPSVVKLAVDRLMREVKTTELRVMCLQVAIAALYYNPVMLFSILDTIHAPNSTVPVTGQFIKQWVLNDCDFFSGVHDRKLCLLGLCCLLNTPGTRPAVINEVAAQLIPAALTIFKGLRRAYEKQARESAADTDSDDEEESEVNGEVAEIPELEDDEDHINEDDAVYMERLSSHDLGLEEDGDDDDDDEDYIDDDASETELESFKTPIDENNEVDEYNIFKDVLSVLSSQDPAWYATVTGHLTKEHQKDIQDVFVLAEQRKAAAVSRKIEMEGGYQFQTTQVPNSFNFGGNPPAS